MDRRVGSAMTGAGLPPPALSVLATNLYAVGAGSQVVSQPSSRLAYRAGAADTITPLPGAIGGTGVWLPQYLRDRLGARPGSTVAVSGTPVRLAGYYRNFYDAPLPAYWCSYGFLVQANALSSDVPPPLVLATDRATFGRLAGDTALDAEWVSTVDTTGETVSRARDVAGRQVAAYHAAGLPVPADFGRTNGGTGQLPTLADRADLIRVGVARAGAADRARRHAAGAAAGRRRRVVLGGPAAAPRSGCCPPAASGPSALAGKAVLELALPAVARHPPRRAAGPLAGRPARPRAPTSTPARTGRRRSSWPPACWPGWRCSAWSPAPAAATRPSGRSAPAGPGWPGCPGRCCCSAARSARTRRCGTTDAVTVVQNVAQVNLLVVLFPLLFILGGSVLTVRLLTLLLPVLSARATRLPPAWYLAARRLTAARVAAVVLLAAAAAPVAIAVYAAGLTAGSQRTLERQGAGLHRRRAVGRDDRPAAPDRGHRRDRHDRAPVQLRRGRPDQGRIARGRPGDAAAHRVLAAGVRRTGPSPTCSRRCPGRRPPAGCPRSMVDPRRRARPDRGRHARHQHRARRDGGDRGAVPRPAAAGPDDRGRPDPARAGRPARRLAGRAVDQRAGRRRPRPRCWPRTSCSSTRSTRPRSSRRPTTSASPGPSAT